MNSTDLKTARRAKGLSQVEAAGRLKVSQSYLAMLEGGVRRLTPELARRAMRVYDLGPTALPPSELNVASNQTASETLAGDLAALGYPGLAYLRPRNWKPKNPGEVLLSALAREDLESRLVEALPWLVLKFWPLDHDWLVREAKLRDLQNRLGLVVTLARGLAERAGDRLRDRALEEFEAGEEFHPRVDEATVWEAHLPEAERRWLVEHRSPEAKRWNVLSDWTAYALRFP